MQTDAAATLLPVSRNSIAVLPFANMSGDPGQEYFCDGVSEEILNVLVRNPDMRVIGRGSSFSFKGRNDDLRTIGRRLGVYQLLEGSVRRQANRVRISAHLIRAADGVELWSQSFDRDLSDILQVQSEIANAIAAKLAAKPMSSAGPARPMTHNIAAYDAYLKALNEYRAPGTGPERAQRFFDYANKAVTLDPKFAEAWALLSEAYIWREEAAPTETGFSPATLEHAQNAALHALELDPNSAGGYFALGYLRWMETSWTAAEDNLHKAWLLEPNNPKFNVYLGESLLNAGRAKEATPILRRAYAADPLIPGALVDLSFALFVQDPHLAEARTLIDEAVALNPERLPSRMIRIILSLGRKDLDLAIEDQKEIDRQASSEASRKFGEGLIAAARDPTALKNQLHSAAKQSASLELDGILLYPWAIAVGDDAFAVDDVVLRTPAQIKAHGWFWVTYLAPQFAPIRKDPRVKQFLKQAKYVDHWRARGWPDNCRALGRDDFECW
jgi:TolB-like protein/Flp pilus assembly protein TadD